MIRSLVLLAIYSRGNLGGWKHLETCMVRNASKLGEKHAKEYFRWEGVLELLFRSY